MKPSNPFKKRSRDGLTTEDALSTVFDDPQAGELMAKMTTDDSALETQPLQALDDEGIDEIIDEQEAERKIAQYKRDFLAWARELHQGNLSDDVLLKILDNGYVVTMDGIISKKSLRDSEGSQEIPPHLCEVQGDLELLRDHEYDFSLLVKVKNRFTTSRVSRVIAPKLQEAGAIELNRVSDVDLSSLKKTTNNVAIHGPLKIDLPALESSLGVLSDSAREINTPLLKGARNGVRGASGATINAPLLHT